MKSHAKPTKQARRVEVAPSELIRSALGKCKKAELLDLLVDFSKQHLEIRRELKAQRNHSNPRKVFPVKVPDTFSFTTGLLLQVDE